jgi:diadenosine tetraphosphate (Ap4A) HIT family hydrolase
MELINVSRILENRSEYDVFYEDELVIGLISPIPIDSGHVVILPKKDCIHINELDKETFLQMNFVATHCSSVIFEALGMQGTNLILYDGNNSGNIFNRVSLHVIGRLNKDGINFKWETKKVSNLDEVAAKIKDQTFFIGKEKKPEIKPEAKPESKEMKEIEGKENYLIKQLIRIP